MNQLSRQRTFVGAALILGVAAFSIGDVLRRVVEGPADASTASVTAAVRDRPGLWLVAGLLEVIAALLLVPGAIGARQLAVERGRVATTIGAGLVVVGAIASMGHTIGYYGSYAGYAAGGLDAGTVDRLERTDDLLGGVVIALFMLGLMVGTVVLTIGLRRAGVVPVWVPVLALVFVVSGAMPGLGAGLVGLLAGLGSLGFVGAVVLRTPSSVAVEMPSAALPS